MSGHLGIWTDRSHVVIIGILACLGMAAILLLIMERRVGPTRRMSG